MGITFEKEIVSLWHKASSLPLSTYFCLSQAIIIYILIDPEVVASLCPSILFGSGLEPRQEGSSSPLPYSVSPASHDF